MNIIGLHPKAGYIPPSSSPSFTSHVARVISRKLECGSEGEYSFTLASSLLKLSINGDEPGKYFSGLYSLKSALRSGYDRKCCMDLKGEFDKLRHFYPYEEDPTEQSVW